MEDIRLSHIDFSYPDKAVITDLNALFPRGSVTAVMGPSGCGKTTLLYLLSGLLVPTNGTITGISRKTALVFQDNRLCPSFDAVANVRFATGRTKSDDEIIACLTAMGLGDSIRKPVTELSGGMQKRVALARAVMYDADLLLLDEAFEGLDEACRDAVTDYVLSMSRGKTILSVTHDPDEASRLGASVFMLE